MIKLDNISLPLEGDIQNICAKKLHIDKSDILDIVLLKKSIDARKKSDIHFNVSVALKLKDEKNYPKYIPYQEPVYKKIEKNLDNPVVVCGAGPAGLFAALTLSKMGLNPILIERGSNVENRIKDIETFHKTRAFNPSSNVQFGEGGAGTFSDGKLNSNTHDIRSQIVLHEFVLCGAPKEILYESKPHIGTDKLPNVVKNIREKIISLGGKVCFNTCLKDLVIENNTLQAIVVEKENKLETINTNHLIIAAGHSARDVFSLLKAKNLRMEQKPFSMGFRCEHSQKQINEIQYGTFANHPSLGSADYKLSVHLPSTRGVYTFCMCPGGTVVAATSEEGHLVVNGMSTFARDGTNANSAILCDVKPSDFGSTDVLAGVEFQRKYEKLAFELAGSSYSAPAQLMGDFMKNQPSTKGGKVTPSYPLGVKWTNLELCLPKFVTSSIREALPLFDQKMHGYLSDDAVLTGIETRSSSPVRILRNENGQSNIQGIFPCGEGAGYSGGILSSAVDGIRQAENLLNIIKKS